MAIEVPTKEYLRSKCLHCGYGCYSIYQIKSNKIQEIVLCERPTKECNFTPFTYIPPAYYNKISTGYSKNYPNIKKSAKH